MRIPSRPLQIPRSTQHFGTAAQSHLTAIEQLPIDLVMMIDDSQREGIRAALDESIRLGYPPDMTGMMIANMVGLFPRWQQAVVNLGNSLTDRGFSEREVAYRMGRYSDWLRERRGLMIARTEIMQAMNTGRMAGWHTQAEQGLLDPELSTKESLSAPDACDECAAINGQIVQGIDGTFDTPWGPMKSGPFHPHCRCTVLIHPVRRPDQYLDSE